MNNDRWIVLAVDACTHAGIAFESVEAIATWDHPYCANAIYYLNGRWYLKIFGPTAARQFHIERAILHTLENHTSIPAPRIIAEGEPAQSPPYLILSEIPGSTAEHVWETLSRSAQLAIARELGTLTAAIHRLPQQDLVLVEQQFGGWHAHVETQQAQHIPLIEATQNLSTQQRQAMLRFMQEEAPALLSNSLKVTHCEMAHNHIYLSQATDMWQVSGIIDWADAMLGPPEWDIAFLWFWTFSRDKEAMRVCLQALYADASPPDQLGRRCLAAILHTHSMPALWAEFVEQGTGSGPIAYEMTSFLFPEDVFGGPN